MPIDREVGEAMPSLPFWYSDGLSRMMNRSLSFLAGLLSNSAQATCPG